MQDLIDAVARHADRAYNSFMETGDVGAQRADAAALQMLRELQNAALTPRYPGIATPIEPQVAPGRGAPDYLIALERHFGRLDNHLEDLYMRCEGMGMHPDECAPLRSARNAMDVAEFAAGEARCAYWVARMQQG